MADEHTEVVKKRSRKHYFIVIHEILAYLLGESIQTGLVTVLIHWTRILLQVAIQKQTVFGGASWMHLSECQYC